MLKVLTFLIALKVLSSEMDPAEIRLIQRSVLKGETMEEDGAIIQPKSF